MKKAANQLQFLKLSFILFYFILGRANISAIESAKSCLSLEPTKVRLEGNIKRAKFNISEDPDKQPEVYWILYLPKSVCVEKGENEFLDKDLIVDKIQLVFEGDGYKRYHGLVNKNVLASGKLFSAHTAHHHTPVLLIVDKFDKVTK